MSELKVASCFEFEKVLRGKSNKLFYPKSEVDEAIAELKDENVRLKRALWLARAERAATWQVHWALCHNHSIEREFLIIGSAVPDDKHTTMKTPREWSIIWKRIYNKCRAKAEEYK